MPRCAGSVVRRFQGTSPKTRAEFCDPDWFAGCGMLVTGGFCYRMLLDESRIARESQNSPAPARASDRLLTIRNRVHQPWIVLIKICCDGYIREGLPMPREPALLTSAGRMPERSQHRVSAGQDVRSERPATGRGQPRTVVSTLTHRDLQPRDALGRCVLPRGLQSLHRRWRRRRQHESAARWRQRLRAQ
jgi:hypothetical protein